MHDDIEISYCTQCRVSTTSSGSGYTGKVLNNINYCIKCYPLMVDVYIAEVKLSQFRLINHPPN